MDHFNALIMAGGGGTRLWPLSRRNRPKQMLPLTEERTMIGVTVDRLDGLLPPERIFIVASGPLTELLRDAVPQLPPENFIIEPSARNSGPAAGLGTYVIAQRDPQAVIAVLSADHHIAREDRFRDSMRCAYEFALKHYVVTIGIEPSFPSTGFGYIRREGKLGEAHGLSAYASGGFREKPDLATAQQFIDSGLYSWNAGMFIWQAQTVRAEFDRQQPAMANGLTRLASSAPDDQLATAIWDSFPQLSIDYAIMEHAQNVAVIPVDMGWSDVGTFAALYDVLNKNGDGNAARSAHDGHIQIDTTNTLVVGDRMVVTIGVDDLVIVDTPDAILVCHRDRAQDVKAVVEALRKQGRADLI